MHNVIIANDISKVVAEFFQQDELVDYQYSIDNFDLTQNDADIKVTLTISVKPTVKILCGGCGKFTRKGYMVKTAGLKCCFDCAIELTKEEVQQ